MCFPKPLVTPAKDTQSEPECSTPPLPPPPLAAAWPPQEGAARRGGECCAHPCGKWSWVVESDIDLGEMLAGTMSRHCVCFPFLWFYCKENTAHSSYCHLATKGNTKTSPPRLAYKSLDLLPISSLDYQGVSSASWGARPPGLFR